MLVELAGITGAILLKHAVLRRLLCCCSSQVRDLNEKEQQEVVNRLMLFVAPSTMVVLSVASLYSSDAFQDPQSRWASSDGPTTAGEWAGLILASFMIYELVLYAAYGKGLAFWVHHVVALTISLNWLVLRIGTFWGCVVLLTEATTPCLVGTRMMKDSGWTKEPVYKLCVACFWLCWLAVRIAWLLAMLSLFCRDLLFGLPEHVPLYFVAVNGLSVLGLLVLSCVWFVPITRIFYQVMTGKSRQR
ncbi:unnamed protein product [Durusdinium trenchii]|uniref:TLC domain-containing protein n=1 Tax=Durusdinium trenchii TaxID=1381693 RepID=A0ABP0IP03_9DINO